MEQKRTISQGNAVPINVIEHIRKRPGMYLGSTDSRGFLNAIKDLISMVFNGKKASCFEITIQRNDEITIVFKGKKMLFESDFCMQVSKEFRCLGLVGINALSRRFEIELFAENESLLFHQIFEKGELKSCPISTENVLANRVKMNFQLDSEIWRNTADWNQNHLINLLQRLSYLYKGKRIDIRYFFENEPCRIVSQHKNGLKDYLESLRCDWMGGVYFETYFEKEFGDFTLEVALAFRGLHVDKPFIKTFVNDEHTHENGTHLDGLLNGLTYGTMKYFKKHELTNDYRISEKGIREDLIAIMNIRMEYPRYAGCVRNKLANPEIIKPIAEYVSEIFFEKVEKDEFGREDLIRKFEI